MFVEKLIDSVQSSQRQLVETFVKHPETQDLINQLIDAHASYTKTVANTVTKLGQAVSDQTSTVLKEITQLDWSQLTEQATKSIKQTTVYDWSKLAELTTPKSTEKSE